MEIAGLTDMRQITAVFAGSLTSTHNHWHNKDTMVDYISKIIFPYLQEKKAALKLPATFIYL